jgi:hypothetical protein
MSSRKKSISQVEGATAEIQKSHHPTTEQWANHEKNLGKELELKVERNNPNNFHRSRHLVGLKKWRTII